MQLQEVLDTPFEKLPPHLGAIAVMGTKGDIKYTWDPKNPDDVNAARCHFAELKAKGFQVFKMRRWRKDVAVEEFDPKDGRLLFVAPEEKKVESGPYRTAADDDGEQVQGEPEVEEANHYVAVPPMQGG